MSFRCSMLHQSMRSLIFHHDILLFKSSDYIDDDVQSQYILIDRQAIDLYYNRMKKHTIPLVLAASLSFFSIDSSAAICTSLSGGTWNSMARWSCGRVPLSTDSVVVAHAITLDANRAIAGLTVNLGATLSGLNRSITSSGPVTINGTYNTGGGNLTTTGGAPLSIGVSGVFNFSNGNAMINGDLTINGSLVSGGSNLQITKAGALLSGVGNVINTTIEIDAAGVTIPAGSNLVFDVNSQIVVGANVTPASLILNGTIDGTAFTAGNRIIRVSSGATMTIGTTGVLSSPLGRLDIRTNTSIVNNGTVTIGELRGRTGAPAPTFTQGPGAFLTINTSICDAFNPTRPCVLNAAAAGNTVTYGAGVTPKQATYYNLAGTACPLPAGVVVTNSNPCVAAAHHVEIRYAGISISCQPKTMTIVACGNAACSTTSTAGVSGVVSAIGAQTNFPAGSAYSIPAGSTQTTIQTWTTVFGATTYSATGGTNASTCNINGAGNCQTNTVDSGLFVTAADHVSASHITVSVQAIEKSTGNASCVPSFTGNQTLGVSCAYNLPATGTKLLVLDFAGIGCSNGTTYSYTKNFDATGTATFDMAYDDVGRIGLSFSHYGAAGSLGLVMTGTTTFIAAPASLSVTTPAGKHVSGTAIPVSISAKNSLGAITSNFGQEGESVSLSYLLDTPLAGANPALSVGAISFVGGTANSTIQWNEIGLGRLHVALSNATYMGSLTVPPVEVGTNFKPDHLKTIISDGCVGCGFTYSGQTYRLDARAENALGQTVTNYAGPVSCQVATTATDVMGGPSTNGALAPPVINQSDWVGGVISNKTAIFTLSSNVAPQDVFSRLIETGCDGVSTSLTTAGKTNVRAGRMKVSNSYGGGLNGLTLPALLQYWNGMSWVVSATDSSTTVAVALSGWSGIPVGATVATLFPSTVIGGATSIRLSPANASGSVMAGLSSPSFLGRVDGKATFGIYAGNKEFIYMRESY